MKVSFDSLNRFEVPKFYVCNPGCTYNNGVLSNTLGALSDTADEELVLNFNTTSELNFRLNKIRREDEEENQYINKLYSAIQNRRLIFVEDVGFFVIRDVTDGSEGNMRYKDVRAESCEYEISQKGLPYIEDGTYQFLELLEKVVSSLPLWKIGDVNLDVARKWRTFEDVSVEANALSFLLEDMQDAYECIFEFDTINRIIKVYDQNDYEEKTNIHLTKDDLIDSIEITESSDDLYTAIRVQGDENLNISPVNPLGGNIIYNFSHYLDWMSPGLSKRVEEWQGLVTSKEEDYYEQNLTYYDLLTYQYECTAEIEKLQVQLDMYRRMRDNIVAEQSTTTVESYNKIIVENGGIPVGVQNELRDTLNSIWSLIRNVNHRLTSKEEDLRFIKEQMIEITDQINAMVEQVSILKYFSQEEYAELNNYIFEGDYTDEYISVTESMTYVERFQQMKTLYDRSVAQLKRISEPLQEFSIDVENFLFMKEFAEWSEQLKTGCKINVELDTGDIKELFLSNITVNYDDKELSMTFSKLSNRFDPKAMFNDVLGNIKKSANSIGYIKEILYPVKNNEFDVLRDAIASSNILTKDAALASENQEFIIDDTGILGRRYVGGDQEYDDKQIKITNQTIVFTDDGWETARTALGNFMFNNPFTGDVEDRYGIVADTLVGNLVLSDEVGIYNTDSSITLDKNGFSLTSDYTSNKPGRIVFTIQKKILDESGNENYTKQLYIDDDGNLVLNGKLGVFPSGEINSAINTVIDDPNGTVGQLEANLKSNLQSANERVDKLEIDLNEDLEYTNGKVGELEKYIGDVDSSVSSVYDELAYGLTKTNENLSTFINKDFKEVKDGHDTLSGDFEKFKKDDYDKFKSSVVDVGEGNIIDQKINAQYSEINNMIDGKLEGYIPDDGQYMTFDDNGLTLGAKTSEYKTVIDNSGIYLKGTGVDESGNKIEKTVSFIDKDLFYIENGVIRKTLTLGNFFFATRNDNGLTLTWQERDDLK